MCVYLLISGSLGCYNPWNYQARALQSLQRNPHSLSGSACQQDFEPSFDAAAVEMMKLDWVGLQDFYHESLCILVYRIAGNRSAYMERCTCNFTSQNSDDEVDLDKHITHGNVRSQIPLDSLTKAKIDRLTAVDR